MFWCYDYGLSWPDPVDIWLLLTCLDCHQFAPTPNFVNLNHHHQEKQRMNREPETEVLQLTSNQSHPIQSNSQILSPFGPSPPFHELCRLLESIANFKAHKGFPLHQHRRACLKQFISHWTLNYGKDLYPCLRLLLPHVCSIIILNFKTPCSLSSSSALYCIHLCTLL